MATYPLPTLACTIDATGISAPSYADILASLKASFQTIYGPDSYLEPDSQDGQLLAIVAKAISDTNDAAIAVYNSFSPQTAQGAGLSSRVKINGLERLTPSNSQVTVTVTGTVGATITSGQVQDTVGGNTWSLPASVVIPPAGFLVTTATCTTPGAIAAAPHTVTRIANPQLGWQSVDNAASASLGAPIESDPALKARQSSSVALPSLSVSNGVSAAVSAVAGVTEALLYENDTGATDSRGIPQHSLSMVVTGGPDAAVAAAINLKKGPGASTYGTTTVTVTDVSGLPKAIKFFRPTLVPISVSVNITALAGYSSVVGEALKQAIVDYIGALPTGSPSYVSRLFLPAQLFGDAAKGYGTYEVNSVLQAVKPAANANADITPLFYQRLTLALADVSLVVV